MNESKAIWNKIEKAAKTVVYPASNATTLTLTGTIAHSGGSSSARRSLIYVALDQIVAISVTEKEVVLSLSNGDEVRSEPDEIQSLPSDAMYVLDPWLKYVHKRVRDRVK